MCIQLVELCCSLYHLAMILCDQTEVKSLCLNLLHCKYSLALCCPPGALCRTFCKIRSYAGAEKKAESAET